MDIILPDDVITLMRNLIEKTRKANKENGFGLCIRDNTIETTKSIIESPVSGPTEVIIPSDCKPGSRYIGSYHTHPGPSSAGEIDLIAACGHVATCIGGTEDNKIMCYLRKDDIDIKKCINEFESLLPTIKNLMSVDTEIEKERELLAVEKDRLIKLKRNRSIDMKIRDLDKRMNNFNLKFRQYKKNVENYYQDRSKLQDKYFDIVEVK